MNNDHEILLKTTRQGYTDFCYWGSVYLANEKKIYYKKGLSPDSIVFMRSVAKPLQASIICDYNIINDYQIKQEDLALFCASHSGSNLHIEKIKAILKKHNLKIKDLSICPQEPLDKRDFKGRKTKLHNNCSAKHTMMLLVSKYLGFDLKGYEKPSHPIQKLIKEKQEHLSEYKSNILTYDGCCTPLWGLPVKNVIKAYFNFFHDDKYKIIIESIIKNPYLFGGYNRQDSEIITLSKGKLFAKVGAGGFIIIYNFKEDEILLIKLAQNNNEARKLITLNILNKINWIKSEVENYEYNQKNQKVAKYCYKF